MKKRIEISTTVVVEFDPTSDKFKNTLEVYRAAFDPNGDVDDLLTQAMSHVARYGIRDNMEFLGHVSEDMRISDPDTWCGIDICDCESDLNSMLDYTIGVYDED